MSSLEQRIQTLEDIEAIRKLKAKYCAACDADHDPDLLGPLFAEDATWEATVMSKAVGREAIKQLLGAVGTSGRIRNSAHHAINPIIEVNGDHATGHWRLIMLYTENLGGGNVRYQRIIGWYRETYVRKPEGWLFQSLFCQVEETAPYSVEATVTG